MPGAEHRPGLSVGLEGPQATPSGRLQGGTVPGRRPLGDGSGDHDRLRRSGCRSASRRPSALLMHRRWVSSTDQVVREAGRAVVFGPADVDRKEDVGRVFGALAGRPGCLDVPVNCGRPDATDGGRDRVRRAATVLYTNLTARPLTARAIIPRPRGSPTVSGVSVSSIPGRAGTRTAAGRCASQRGSEKADPAAGGRSGAFRPPCRRRGFGGDRHGRVSPVPQPARDHGRTPPADVAAGSRRPARRGPCHTPSVLAGGPFRHRPPFGRRGWICA